MKDVIKFWTGLVATIIVVHVAFYLLDGPKQDEQREES